MKWILLGLLGFTGCRHATLGEDFGKKSRAAFDAQTRRDRSRPNGPMDAHDAKNVLEAHRSTGKDQTQSQGIPGAPAPLDLEGK